MHKNLRYCSILNQYISMVGKISHLDSCRAFGTHIRMYQQVWAVTHSIEIADL